MRISTLSMFERSVTLMNRQQADFQKVGTQIATGKRVVTPADDPQAASRALGVSQALAVNEQYLDARVSVRNSLSQQESVLNSVTDNLIRARTLMLQASNDTLGEVDRASVAKELEGIRDSLLGQANATDGNGRFLFGGYQDSTAPFVRDMDGAINYVGDSEVKLQRVDSARLMPMAENGVTVFQQVSSGAGYLAEAGVDNQGGLTFVGPHVEDASDPDYGQVFEISFEVAGDDRSYRINGGPAHSYEPGEAIRFGGLVLEFEGLPADGDSIRVGRAGDMNTDIFATLDKVISALQTPGESANERALIRNTLTTALREVDNSQNNVLTLRAGIGARLNELDAIDLVASNRMISYEQTLSDLVDLDWVKAVSEYTLRQVGLEAAQKSFVDTGKLSLFSLL